MAFFVLLIASAISLAPILLLVISSFTDSTALVRNGYSFFPTNWSIEAYVYLWNRIGMILNAYGMSFLVTFLGTTVSLFFTCMLAYSLSNDDLPGRKLISFLVYFTILFNGGLVPTYLLYTNYLKINDTFLSLILPNLLVRAYYVILIRNYYKGLPKSIIEAARIDGASEFKTFKNVVLPMAKPIIATVMMFTAIGYWNDWQNGLYYLSKRTDLYTIQNLLNRMISEIQYLSSGVMQGVSLDLSNFPSAAVRMAIAVIGVLPIIIVYPFIQKNFAKGIIDGAVKG